MVQRVLEGDWALGGRFLKSQLAGRQDLREIDRHQWVEVWRTQPVSREGEDLHIWKEEDSP